MRNSLLIRLACEQFQLSPFTDFVYTCDMNAQGEFYVLRLLPEETEAASGKTELEPRKSSISPKPSGRKQSFAIDFLNPYFDRMPVDPVEPFHE